MQKIKLIVLFIVSFFASFLIFALVLPSRFSVEYFIEIDRRKETVFKILKNLQERKNWYTLVDSNLVSTIQINGDGTKGSKFIWKKGEVEVVQVDTHYARKLENKLKFNNYLINAGFTSYSLNAPGRESFEIVEAQHKTTVTWILEGGPLEYPLGKVVLAAVRYKLYKEMQKSLEKLKEYIESKPEETPKEEFPQNYVQIQPPQQQQSQEQPQQEQQQDASTTTPQND